MGEKRQEQRWLQRNTRDTIALSIYGQLLYAGLSLLATDLLSFVVA